MSYSSTIQTSFSGPSDTSTYPPHNGLAVGSNYVVMIEGSQIEWTNLTGGSPTVQSVYSFFSPLSPTGGLFDQRVVYDSVNQRFVAIMEYLAPDGTTTDVDIAVSKDSNPNDGWTFSQLNTTVTINGQSTDSDRPTLAVDGSNVYITAPQYNINVSGYAGTENWVIGDTAGAGGGIYGGGTLSVTASEVMPSTQGIFAVAAGNNGKTYYASDSSSGGQIVIALQTYDKTTNTFSATSTIALGNIDQGGSYTAQQQGTSLLLDAGGDNRIANMVYANGFLYGVAEMKPVGSSVPLVHWFKIDVSNPSAPSLVAQGDISGAAIGTSVATFNPSIAVDASGDVIINFTASGPNMYPADYYVFQGGGDPAGSFSAPVLYQASTGFFNSGDGNSTQAWGANSSATVDPNNPNSFWLSNEYVASGWWQTSVARVAIQSSTPGPAISSIATSGTGITNGSGDLNAGKVVTLTVNFTAAVTVNTAGGTPALTLNDGGTASYTGGSGGTALTFSYTVAAGQNTADLIVSALSLNGATITDGGGNAANLSGATNYNPTGTLQIDTTVPTITSIVASGTGITNGSGNVSTGQVVTLTVNLSEAVTVNTAAGAPTLTLNDGGTASYTNGSGSSALTFSYTVAAGQTTSDLAISALNLNGAVIGDGAGNAANLAGATNYNPAGILQVNTTAPTIASIATSGTGITNGSGDLNAGKVVTLTVNFSAAVTVNTAGGTPALTLNDGGTASYTGGSGGTALTFSYTVAAGQNTADLIVSSFSLNGATIIDGNGNAANLSAATNYNPAGILQIDTTAPTIASIVATGTGITNGSGNVSTGQVVTLTVNLSEAVTVNTAGGAPTLTLNDGGTANYTGGSGGTALTFSYTVAAGQTTSDLAISSLNLNGAVISDGAGNGANLAGATNYNPAGILQVNLATPTSSIQTLFSGPSTTSNYPPHNGLAVGSNFVVMIEGSLIEWTNLAGGSPTQQSVYSFFSSLSPTGGLFDQRIAYDSVNQRFVAMMEYLAPDGTTTAMDIAVSKDSNPNDGWTFSQLNTTVTINGQSTDSDRPMLAVDGSNVYITAPQYNISVSGFAGTENWVISDTAGAGGGIYGGGTLSVTASEAMPSTQRIFAVAAGNNGKTYYASDFSSGGQIVVALQTYDKATNTFSTTSTIALGNIDQGGSYTVQQQGTSLLLDAVDNRIASMVYANGYLYAVAEMKPSGSSVPLVHWFKIDVGNPSAPSLVAQGDISGASLGTSVGTFDPSIAVDASGDVVINFTASGPNLYPSDYYVFQSGSSPAGSFSAPILYQASTGFFNSGDGNSVQRWGLNSSATVDPNNPSSFWISSEYVANNWWQTSVAQIAIQAPAGTGTAISSIVASGTGITNGSGDLNAGKVVTLTVNFAAAVTVNTSGGTPTLALNDGGTASYTGGSGGTALTFSYTVAAGQNTADLVISSFNLNGASITDGSGNAANLSAATNYNPLGTLQIDTTAPTIASIVASGTGITNGNGNVSTGQVVTLTVNLNEAVTVNTTGGTPTLTLNDGGIASYTSGSGGTALTFSYTVAAGQTTSDLAISALNLNGAVINDGAGNAANLSGAVNYTPTGALQVNWTNPTGVPKYSHIVVVVEENHNYDQIAGNTAEAPYINSLMAGGASLTNMTAEAHPSQPNYFVLYAGSTFGTTDDNAYSLPDPTLYTVLHNGGYSFTGYVDETNGGSDFNHDPWVSFPEARTVQTDFTSFPALFANGNYSSLPTVSYVIPSVGNDMHNGTIAQGDTWLQQNLSAYAQWAVNNNSLLIVTWDENDDSTSEAASNQVPTLLYGANVVPGNYSTAYNHYNLLSTITDSLGLTAPNSSATAAPIQVFGGAAAPPSATITSIAASGTGITNGSGDLNAGKVVTLTVNFTAAVTVSTTGGTPALTLNDGGTASYTGGSGGTALTFSYTVAAGQNTADLIVSSLTLNGATITDGGGNAANLSGATNYNPAGTLQIDTTAPTIAISTIAGNNIINATKGSQGFAISGTTTDAENGRTVTVNILNSANAIVNSYATTDSSNAWSVAVTSAQATGLADGSYTVSANVSDAAGNPAQTATRALTVDQDRVPEVPALTISSTSLTVPAGGSVALGITATPVDSDDKLSLTIGGLPSYESITAPAGNTVTSSHQSNGTYTWTITEGSSTTGMPLTGLTLSSSYTGTGHPVATLTVTARNTTTGETATSASQTMTVTDPPVDPSGGGAVSSPAGPAIGWPQGNIDRLAALMDQFAAAGFRGDPSGPVPSALYQQVGAENPFLAAPHFHTG
ncbi:alkaline phosphatase family protein [Bradyrhizobium ganzhouense]|uniref:alkaline phosphatase family protein n=1 Tax=Bradyrhizobium ganzhouense TaxID=1179767 RepID=UPI003CF1A343